MRLLFDDIYENGVIRAVLCDLDGLLADTEVLHFRAYRDAFRSAGVELSEFDYSDHWIRAGLGVVEYVATRNLGCNPRQLRRHKAGAYRTLVKNHVKAMPGALDLLERLKGRQRLALATSGHREDVHAVLDRLGITGYFESITTAHDVTRLKPHPDIFLHAASRLGVCAGECLVLEDAEKGVLAARSAGMRVIAVPTPQTHFNDFSSASAIVSSLAEITLEMIAALV